MSELTADAFRALARSAPWLFTTLRFSFRRRDGRDDLEAWLSRPGRLRVRMLPLLWGEVSEGQEEAAGGPTWRAQHPDVTYPTAWLIGLDRETGVVVDCTPVGGSRPEAGFSVTIHVVDGPMPDALFTDSSA